MDTAYNITGPLTFLCYSVHGSNHISKMWTLERGANIPPPPHPAHHTSDVLSSGGEAEGEEEEASEGYEFVQRFFQPSPSSSPLTALHSAVQIHVAKGCVN